MRTDFPILRRAAAAVGTMVLVGGVVAAVAVPSATAATGSTLSVSPTSLVEQSTGNTLAFTYTVPVATTAGTLKIPFPGNFKALGSLSVTASTCTSVTPSTGSGGLTIKVAFDCPAKSSFTITDSDQTAPKKVASDTLLATTNGTAITSYPTINITSGPATKISLTGLGTSADTDVPQAVTVTALDSGGNIATSYAGTVRFSTTDEHPILPAPYTFVPADNGQHVFQVALYGPGKDTVYVTDNSSPTPFSGQKSTMVHAPTSVTVGPSGQSIVAGTTQAFTATANFADGTTVSPDPYVIWSTQAPSVATITKTGIATGQGVGSDTIYATLAGTEGSTSLGVTQATANVSLKSSANPATPDQSVVFTATVTGSPTPTGTVTFSVAGSQIGSPVTVSKGTASITDSSLPLGDATVSAVYSGDANNSTASTSLTETSTEATSLSLGSNDNPAVDGDTVTFTATVSPVSPGAQTPAGTVTFTDTNGDSSTVALAGGTAQYQLSSLPVGDTTVTATYNPADDSTSSSADSITQEVDSSTSTAVTSDDPSGTPGTNADYTATVTANDSGTAPSGTVTVTATDAFGNVTTIGTESVTSNGNNTSSAVFTQDYPGPGTYTITATFTPTAGSFDAASANTGSPLTQTFN